MTRYMLFGQPPNRCEGGYSDHKGNFDDLAALELHADALDLQWAEAVEFDATTTRRVGIYNRLEGWEYFQAEAETA